MSEKRGPGNPNWKQGMDSPNPKGRPSTARKIVDWISAAFRSDTWTNVLTGQGTATHDKRLAGYFVSDWISEDQGRELWRGDDLGARIVETIVKEALRKRFNIRITDDTEGNDESYGPELIKRIEAKWKALDLFNVIKDAWCIERACGGSVIVLGADDGAQSLEEPLNLERVRSFEWLTVLEPREVTPYEWYTDARAPKFGKVKIYELNPIVNGWSRAGVPLASTHVKIHESRLVVLPGIKVSRANQWGTVNGFGDNVFTRVFRVLNDFNSGFGGAGRLVSEFATPVFKVAGLADIIANDNKELFQARMQALAMAISTHRAALIDMTEEFTRQQVPVTGLPELLELMMRRVAGAADCPVSVLWGESPGGLNASGAQGDQLSIWYARVDAERTGHVVPIIEYITRIIFATMGGEPDEWCIEPEPLWMPTAKEQADTNKVRTDEAIALYDRGVLSSEELRRSPELDLVGRHGIVIDDEPDTVEPTEADEQAFAAGQQPPIAGTDPNADPNAAPSVTPEGGTTEIAKEAMNGAQITSLVEVITAVASGQLSRESGQKILELAFQLTPADAIALLGPPDFKPAQPDAGFNPFAPAPNEDPNAEPKPNPFEAKDKPAEDEPKEEQPTEPEE